jgi:hypothetical protein
MSGNEVLLGYAWLQSTLQGDSTLVNELAPGGVFRSLADPGTSTPYIIVSFQSGSDTTTFNGFRVLTQMTFQVKAVGPASDTASLASASSRLDVLLGGPPTFPPGGVPITIDDFDVGWMYSCIRQSPLSVDELVDGKMWTNAGGLYRLEVGQIY